jgi:hypothetical protein
MTGVWVMLWGIILGVGAIAVLDFIGRRRERREHNPKRG